MCNIKRKTHPDHTSELLNTGIRCGKNAVKSSFFNKKALYDEVCPKLLKAILVEKKSPGVGKNRISLQDEAYPKWIIAEVGFQ